MKTKLPIEFLKENATQVAARLRAFANRDRLIMLCRLSEGEASVSELIAITGIPQSSVSQHLSNLREAGIVSARAEQQQRYYSISDGMSQKIMDALCEACAPPPPGGGA